MTETALAARHPSPVRFVPDRGRNVRRRYETIETPVRIRHADPESFRALGRTDDALSAFWRADLHVHEEALWRPLRTWDATRSRPMREDELAACLRGDPDLPPHLARSFPDALRGTPVLGCRRHFANPEKDVDEPGGERIAARVRQDDPERARRALRAFLDADLRIAGGNAWVRATPLAAPVSSTVEGVVRFGLDPVDRMELRSGRYVPVRPDRPGDYLDGVRPERRLPPPGPGAVPPSRYLRDDDVAQLANQAPGLVEGIGRALVAFRRSPQVRGAVPAEVAAAIEEMADLAMWGAIGAIGPGEAEAALLAAAQAADVVERIQGRDGLDGDGPTIAIPGLRFMAHHVRTRVMPRLDAADPEAEAALGRLAP